MLARFPVRILIIAAAFAFVGDIFSAAGAITLLCVGVLAVIWAAKRGSGRLRLTALAEFGYWLLSMFGFAAFAVLFAPFAQTEATTIALVVLSPLFGSFVYAVAAVSCSLGDAGSADS